MPARAKAEAEAKAKAEAEPKAKAEAEPKAKAEAVTGAESAAEKAKADTEADVKAVAKAVAEAVAEAVPDLPAAKMAVASVNEEKRREETRREETRDKRDEGRLILPRAAAQHLGAPTAAQPLGAPSPWVGRALELLEDASAQTGVPKTTLAAAIVGGAVAGTAFILGSFFRRK